MTAREPLFKAGCPSRLILDQIADKWSVLILAALCKQPLRFNAIKRELDGITQKALTQSLRRLERNGIVARRVMPVSPVAVEYRITPLGQTLKAPFEALYRWTVDYLPQVEAAQQDFDLRGASDAARGGIEAVAAPAIPAIPTTQTASMPSASVFTVSPL